MGIIGVAFLLAALFAVFFRFSKIGFVPANQELVIRHVRQNQNYALQIAGTLDTKYGECYIASNYHIESILKAISSNPVVGKFSVVHVQKLNNQSLLLFANYTSAFSHLQVKGSGDKEKQMHSFSIICSEDLLEVYSEFCCDSRDHEQKISFAEELTKSVN